MPFPPEIIEAYGKLENVFTSGDLMRMAGISRSTAKYYINKMMELRMIPKVPNKRKYQKYANAEFFSDWLRDLIKLVIVPIERGELKVRR